MRAWLFWFLIAKLLFQTALSQTNVSPAREVLRFDISIPKSSEAAVGGMVILANIFGKYGYDLQFLEFPLQRGLEELRKGRLDGSAGRVAETDMNQEVTGYERLSVPITYSTLMLWCQKNYAEIPKTRRLKLAHIRGATIPTLVIDQVDKSQIEVVPLNSFEISANMLNKNRIDCMLAWRGAMEDIGTSFKKDNYYVHPIVTNAFYTWISKKLVPLKKHLEQDLMDYPFPEEWARKFRSPMTACQNSFNIICPDGVIFTTKVDLFKRNRG